MLNRYSLILFGFLVTWISFSCAQQSNGKEDTITIEQLNERYGKDSNLVVLDVRTKEELTGPLGQLEEIIHIPLQILEMNLNKLAPYKDKEIAIICRSGNRSGVAVGILKQNGFNAKNVLGGDRKSVV